MLTDDELSQYMEEMRELEKKFRADNRRFQQECADWNARIWPNPWKEFSECLQKLK